MIKKNKWEIFISSIIILLPIVFGIIFWNELPEKMPIHWGVDGNVDGWSNRFFAVFALPLFILITHWLCVFFTLKDPKNKNQNNKVFGIVIWITPVVSLFANGMVYAVSLGKQCEPYLITTLLVGIGFIIIGNYLPKCKQNHTIGIRVKWTLESEENWNATHRISGKLWVVGGILMMMTMFLPSYIVPWVIIISVIIFSIVPVIYSYRYHRKQIKEDIVQK